MSIRKFDNKKGTTYEVRFTYKDKYGVKQYYSKRGFKTPKEAKRHENYMKEKIKQGRVIKSKTFDEVFNEYIENNDLQVTTKNLYRRNYNLHIKKHLGSVKINIIDYDLLQSYLNDVGKTHSKNKTAKLSTVIKNTFIFAYNYGYIDKIPFARLNLSGSVPIHQNKIISDEEFSNLLKFTENEAFKVLFQIAHYTGLRVGEILALEKKDINFEKNTITINKTLYYDESAHTMGIKKPKTDASNSAIPMPKKLKNILIEWFNKNDCEIIINDNKNYVRFSTINNHLTRFNKKYNTHITMHMFRHTYSTILYKKGIDPKTAQTLLRHKDFNTTMSIYTHLQENELNSIVDNIFN